MTDNDQTAAEETAATADLIVDAICSDIEDRTDDELTVIAERVVAFVRIGYEDNKKCTVRFDPHLLESIKKARTILDEAVTILVPHDDRKVKNEHNQI